MNTADTIRTTTGRGPLSIIEDAERRGRSVVGATSGKTGSSASAASFAA